MRQRLLAHAYLRPPPKCERTVALHIIDCIAKLLQDWALRRTDLEKLVERFRWLDVATRGCGHRLGALQLILSLQAQGQRVALTDASSQSEVLWKVKSGGACGLTG